jgi:CubicO group peptidase (beta-lactamase class C family)
VRFIGAPGRRAIVVLAGGACLAVSAGVGHSAMGASQASSAADGAAAVIATYRERIPQLMAEQDVPGLAVALVDRDEVLWTEGFGHLDRDGSAPVTVDTIFSVQSMSKNFTAVAVMQAVEAGLLDLDAPITTYLPNFTVHSVFEDLPERKITLRMLLSHTAGFTHEAPIGNNYEWDPGTFDEHVVSISDTWLRFPVGSGYAYSNLGIDLAGAILARVSGASFPAVLRDSLLGPLGMDRSTFDRAEIVAATDRAIGHAGPVPNLPAYDAMTAAGGLYSSATDLARYLRFQLGDGSLDGVGVLDPALMTEMRTIPAPDAGAPAGYALGVVRYRWRVSRNAELFSHGGGGFGFLSDLWWSPPLGVGVAVLTNSSSHELHGGLALSILSDLVHEPGSDYEERLLALPEQPAAVDPDGAYIAPAGMADLVRAAGMTPRGDEAERWAPLCRHLPDLELRGLRPDRSARPILRQGRHPVLRRGRGGRPRPPPPHGGRTRPLPHGERTGARSPRHATDVAQPRSGPRQRRSRSLAVGAPRRRGRCGGGLARGRARRGRAMAPA